MTEAQRLFFALWPGGVQRQALERARAGVEYCGGRAVPPENLHITLVFLGTVGGQIRQCAVDVASGVRAAPFELELDCIGYWRRPRILWAGSHQTPSHLLALVQQLSRGLVACGLAPERRPFEVHVTLARKVKRAHRQRLDPPVRWPVDAFCLMESRNDGNGVAYQALQSWPLQHP